MALRIYNSADPNDYFSIDGDFSTPLSNTFDGSRGAIIQRRLYLRNDSLLYYYTGITIAPVISSGKDIVSGVDGYSWKLISGDTEPVEAQWELLASANTLSMDDLGESGNPDIATYSPFWLRIRVPKGARVESHQGVVLRISYTQNSI